MAYNAANIRTAITELLEGDIGSVRTLTAAVFKYGVHEGMTELAQKSTAVQTATGRHWFDVELGALTRHPDTPVSANSNYRLAVLDIRIPFVSAVRSTAEGTQRSTDLATIASAMDDAIQALHYRDNVKQTAAAGATNIVSGLLMGPGGGGSPEWRITDEAWDEGMVRGEIACSAILNITQATS